MIGSEQTVANAVATSINNRISYNIAGDSESAIYYIDFA